MSSVPSNYSIKILYHPSFTEVSNSKMPGKFGKNISMINSNFFKLLMLMQYLRIQIQISLELGNLHLKDLA